MTTVISPVDPGTPEVLRRQASLLDKQAANDEAERDRNRTEARNFADVADVYAASAATHRAQASDLRHLAAQAEQQLREFGFEDGEQPS